MLRDNKYYNIFILVLTEILFHTLFFTLVGTSVQLDFIGSKMFVDLVKCSLKTIKFSGIRLHGLAILIKPNKAPSLAGPLSPSVSLREY